MHTVLVHYSVFKHDMPFAQNGLHLAWYLSIVFFMKRSQSNLNSLSTVGIEDSAKVQIAQKCLSSWKLCSNRERQTINEINK